MVTRASVPRRKTDWFDNFENLDISSGGQSLQRITPAGFQAGLTLTRTLVTLTVYPSVPGAATAEQVVHYGIGLASEDAFGASVVPDPNVEFDAPPRGWVIRSSILVQQAITPITGSRLVDINLDVRAQRMIDNGVLYLVVNNDPVRGTPFNVRVIGWVRLLCLLP